MASADAGQKVAGRRPPAAGQTRQVPVVVVKIAIFGY